MASLSKSLNPTIVIVPIDFKNVPEFPKSHMWEFTPQDYQTNYSNIGPMITNLDPVPIIDLSHRHAAELIREACEKWGVFQVINHGIPMNLFDEVDKEGKRLFGLPAEQKLAALKSPESITGYGTVPMSSFFNKQMWHEGFTMMGSPSKHARQLWPNDDHHRFCQVMEEFQDRSREVAEKIIGLVLKSLGLNQEDLSWFQPNKPHYSPNPVLQLNSYPVCPSPSEAMGLAPHTDSPLFTLVYQGNVGGLEVRRDDVGWVHWHPASGVLEFLVGDLLHIITNGRFKNVLHRVVVNDKRHRISTSYFYGPPKDVRVSPMAKLIDPDHPIMYKPISWKEYLEVKSIHFNETLEMIKCKDIYSIEMAKP